MEFPSTEFPDDLAFDRISRNFHKNIFIGIFRSLILTSVRPAYPGFIVMKSPIVGISVIISPMKLNLIFLAWQKVRKKLVNDL